MDLILYDFLFQGTFGVHEKIENVMEFVRENLEDESLNFHLTTPTGHKLTSEDETKSLVDLRLVPATILTFVVDSESQPDRDQMYLKGEVMVLVQPICWRLCSQPLLPCVLFQNEQRLCVCAQWLIYYIYWHIKKGTLRSVFFLKTTHFLEKTTKTQVWTYMLPLRFYLIHFFYYIATLHFPFSTMLI